MLISRRNILHTDSPDCSLRVLVVGAGAREHALAWKFSQSPLTDEVFIAPSNAGTEGSDIRNLATNIADLDELESAVADNEINLIIFGGEVPLAAGFAEHFRTKGFTVLGPDKEAANLEGSKAWAKQFMQENGIPTAEFEVLDNAAAVSDYLANRSVGDYVVKASGLAAGKGVLLPSDMGELTEFCTKLEQAGNLPIVVERRLSGRECSAFCFISDESYSQIIAACDYKRIYDGDRGPNTGGMGAYSKPTFWSDALSDAVKKRVIEPLIAGLAARNLTYRGVLYIGLIVDDKNDLSVLEFNIRFGDPECQVIMTLLSDDIVTTMLKTANGTLEANAPIGYTDEAQAAVGVVLAAKGYPASDYQTGCAIDFGGASDDAAQIFHAGTKRTEDGRLVTAGGRVCTVVAVGGNLPAARASAYRACDKIKFDGAYYRKDIADVR